MTTPADRAKAMVGRFGKNHYLGDSNGDGYYAARAEVDELLIVVSVLRRDNPALIVDVYDMSFESVLTLDHVQDDDLVASIIQQVIDHHNGRQVV